MKITWKLIIILMLAGAVLAGCAQADAASGPRVGSISEEKFAKTASGEEMFFTIPVDQKFLDSGQKISIRANGNIGQGRLHLVLRDPAGQTAWDPGAFGGEFQVNTYAQPKTVGDYQLGIFWDGAVSGSYQLSYQALALTAAALIPGLGMILVAVGFTVYSRRKGGSWRYLLLGGLVWFAAVAIKFAWAIPINSIVYKALNVSLSQLASPGNLAAYIYVGLLTGVTEVLFMWLLLRYTRKGRTSWANALAFGVGVGALEAFLLGLSSLGTMGAALAQPQGMPAALLANAAQTSNLLFDLAPISERIFTTFAHILACVLLFYAVQKGQARWMWLSFAFMTLLDSVAAFAQFWGVSTLGRIWTIEAAIIAFGLVAWWGMLQIEKRYGSEPVSIPTEQNSYETLTKTV